MKNKIYGLCETYGTTPLRRLMRWLKDLLHRRKGWLNCGVRHKGKVLIGLDVGNKEEE